LKVEYVEESSVRKSLSFEIELEVLEAEVEKRAQGYARKLKLPGFRPGKIPIAVVKARFAQELLQDAAESIVNRVVPEELSGRGLSPVASPEVADLKLAAGQPLSFRAVFEILPIIELPEYRGLPLTPASHDVSDAELESELERLRNEAARYEPVDGRPVREGDHVVVDVSWSEGDDGKTKRQDGAMLHVGSTEHHPDLNAALVGMTPGDTREVAIAYAADAPPDLAGKSIHYRLTLKSIKTQILPTLDDEFAKDLGEFDSLEALRADLRRRLEERKRHDAEHASEEALIDALVAKSDFEVPEALIERHMTARTETTARGLALSGVDPTKVGVDWGKYRAAQREKSLRSAKAEILLDEIARRESIDVQPTELEAELARLAERTRTPTETLRRRMQEDGGLASLRARIRTAKTLDLLKANARLTRP
jgi:trigger factor